MKNNIIELTKKLIEIPSVDGNTKSIEKILDVSEKALGKGFFVEKFQSKNIKSILVSNRTNRPKKFKVILNAHLDVVPANQKQFKPQVSNGRLYGRGAYDMKAAAAAIILLYKEVAKELNYPLGLQLTTDEESGGLNGAAFQINKGVRADFVVTGEGSNFRAIHQSKGKLSLKMIAKGKSSHSAYPWLGDNAILKMNKTIFDILNAFPSHKAEEYKSTINLTYIATKNTAVHTVTPDYCEAILDVRFVLKDRDIILSKIKSLLPDVVSHEVMQESPVHFTKADNIYINLLRKATKNSLNKELILGKAHGTSDVRHFVGVGGDGVEFGPIGGNHHQIDEWVDISSLNDYYKILKDFLLSI